MAEVSGWGVRIMSKIEKNNTNILEKIRKSERYIGVKKNDMSKKVKEVFEKQKHKTNFKYIIILFWMSLVLYESYKLIPEIMKNNLNIFLYIQAIVMIAYLCFFIASIYIIIPEYTDFIIPIIVFYWLFSTNLIIIDWKILICIIFIIFITLFTDFERNTKIKPWFLYTIFIMSVCFFVGTLLLDNLYGYDPISLQLNEYENVTNKYDAILECNPTDAKYLFVGSHVNCRIIGKYKTDINNATTTFTPYLGDKREINTMELIEFITPENVSRIHFKINATNPDGDMLLLEAAGDRTFYSHEEFRERNEKFITYMILLLGVIFITIPSMVLNFKRLVEK